jgi:AcrR family transcriptional regulator
VSLRDEQKALTERKILDAVLTLVAREGSDQITVPAVARESGVSVPTIYRHFPTKDAMVDAAAWVPSSSAAAVRPTNIYDDGFRDYLATLWKSFAENLPLVRRQAASTAGRSMRVARLEAGRAQLAEGQLALGVDPDSPQGRRLTSLCLLLGGSLALLELHDRQGLSVDAAADEVAWAGRVLLDATLRELEEEG